MTSENGEPGAGAPTRVGDMRYFPGWTVVGGAGLMAFLSFGLGFYSVGVYLATLQRLHGWSASAVSVPITVYYVAGALWTMAAGHLFERFGPRVVVAAGGLALAAGVAALGVVGEPWHLYPVFLVMAAGWGSMSGAAINIVLAPWFVRRRGLAVSLAFNGATLGGVIVAPSLLLLIGGVGFPRALAAAALVALVGLVAVAALVLRRGPHEFGLGPDGDPPGPAPSRPAAGDEGRARAAALRTWRFWSVSVPFALGLAAQVGVVTHLVALATPLLGARGAAGALGTVTGAALVGRLLTGLVIDRLNRRLVAAATLLVQMAGLGLLAGAASPMVVYAGCALFGLGVGNLTSLPGLILAVEWPREQFSALVALVVGINQLTFALGPSLVGLLRDHSATYTPALLTCMSLQAIAAALIAWPSPRHPLRVRESPDAPIPSGPGRRC